MSTDACPGSDDKIYNMLEAALVNFDPRHDRGTLCRIPNLTDSDVEVSVRNSSVFIVIMITSCPPSPNQSKQT